MKAQLMIRILGTLPSFQRELGCRCPRCHDPDLRQRGPTSASVILRHPGGTEHHLVDAGEGIGERLFEEDGPWPLTAIWLTHGHADHILGMNRIVESLYRSRDAVSQSIPIPVCCTSPAWESGPKAVFPYLMGRMEHRPVSPGRPLSLGSPLLTFTALPVIHSPGSVIWVVQAGEENGKRVKVVLCWDLKRFTRPEDRPEPDGQWGYHQNLDEDSPLLQEPDVLIIDAMDFKTHPDSNHGSVETAAALAKKWKAKTTRIVHYLGHADCENGIFPADNKNPAKGPVTSAALRLAIHARYGSGLDVARAGESFCFHL